MLLLVTSLESAVSLHLTIAPCPTLITSTRLQLCTSIIPPSSLPSLPSSFPSSPLVSPFSSYFSFMSLFSLSCLVACSLGMSFPSQSGTLPRSLICTSVISSSFPLSPLSSPIWGYFSSLFETSLPHLSLLPLFSTPRDLSSYVLLTLLSPLLGTSPYPPRRSIWRISVLWCC